MKFLDILKTASSNIGQSKLRTALTVIAVFIGAFTLTLTNGVGSGISRYIDSQVENIGSKDQLIIQAKDGSVAPGIANSTAPKKYDPAKATSSSGFGFSIPVLTSNDIARIGAVSGIKDVSPRRSVSPDYILGSNGQRFEFPITSFDAAANLALNAGSKPDNASSSLQVNLPYNYPVTLGFASDADALGKPVTIGITDATGVSSEVTASIVGVAQKSLLNSSGATINTVLLDRLYLLQNVGLPAASQDKYQSATAHVLSGSTAAQITDIKKRLADSGYQAQTVQDRIGILKQIINGIVIVFDLFALITLLAASFGVINTLLMAVQERTKEIGLMKAMGMGANRIFLLFSAEAVLLGFWGSFLGVVAAVGVGSVINRVASTGFLKDFEGLQLLAFPLSTLVTIVLIIMVIAFLAGTLPARRAAKLDPINALRYE